MRALVLSGGGAKGAYEAGAIKHLLGDLGIHYDIVAGVSVGAINGAYLTQFAAGSELDAATSLVELWHDISTKDVYRKWYKGVLWNLPAAWKGSVYDSSPLHSFLRKRLKPTAMKTSGKILRVVAVDKMSSERGVWTEQDDDIVDGVCASAAFPMFLTPVSARGGFWVDGGVRDTVPLRQAIQAGATRVDVVCVNPDSAPPYPAGMGNTVTNIKQAIDALMSEIERNDLEMVEFVNRLVRLGDPKSRELNRRDVDVHVIRPDGWLMKDSLDFDQAKARENIERGYADAKRMTW
jgi:NTE family protein